MCTMMEWDVFMCTHNVCTLSLMPSVTFPIYSRIVYFCRQAGITALMTCLLTVQKSHTETSRIQPYILVYLYYYYYKK